MDFGRELGIRVWLEDGAIRLLATHHGEKAGLQLYFVDIGDDAEQFLGDLNRTVQTICTRLIAKYFGC